MDKAPSTSGVEGASYRQVLPDYFLERRKRANASSGTAAPTIRAILPGSGVASDRLTLEAAYPPVVPVTFGFTTNSP